MFLLLLFLQAAMVPQQATVPHQATLYWQSSSCTSNNPCQLQVWRAVCATPATCPTYVAGATAWTRVTTGSASASPKPNGTQWTVIDQDPVLQDATTYVYVATTSYVSAPTVYSDASPPWSGTTNGPNASVPLAPSVGTGNVVN
jgi:hypothetical protein